MTVPSYSAADYLSALQSLFPRGRVWPREPDAALTKALSGLTPIYERMTLRANNLLVDAFPQTVNELLPEWESSLGLPDSCAGNPTTIPDRQNRVVAKLQEPGGMSKAYFLNLATVLGYADTTITEFGPSTCEMSCESPVVDESWRFVWEVNLPHQGDNHSYMRADSRCDARIDSYAFGALECMFMKLKPAHTYVIFTYKGLT